MTGHTKQPTIVTLPDCGDDLALGHICWVQRQRNSTYLVFVGGEEHGYLIATQADRDAFEAAWQRFMLAQSGEVQG